MKKGPATWPAPFHEIYASYASSLPGAAEWDKSPII